MRGQHIEERETGDPCMVVRDLVINYRVRVHGSTASGRKHRRRKVLVEAVRGVSFTVGRGEIVGFLGPNGAGKTSVLKSLSGLLHPSSGTVDVLGHTPHRRSSRFLSEISLCMGQRNQLLWDLPPVDSFLANKAIYRIPDARYHEALTNLVDLLGLKPMLDKPVRQLSLGERTRCELAAALLHEPRVLFLDEPTLGLDVDGQQALREFVVDYRRKRGATVIITSHDMADIVNVSDRVMLIDNGRIRFDGSLNKLVDEVAPYSVIRCRTSRTAHPPLPEYCSMWWEADTLCVRVPRALATETAKTLLTDLDVTDLTIVPPAVEDVLRGMITRKDRAERLPADHLWSDAGA